MSEPIRVTGYVNCEHCGGVHEATYSHQSDHGNGPYAVYVAVCDGQPQWVEDFYTLDGVMFGPVDP